MKSRLVYLVLLCCGILFILGFGISGKAATTSSPTPDYAVSANAGQSVSWNVTVGAGTLPFTFQWMKNGVAIPGATSKTGDTSNGYNIPSVQPTDAGKYSVVISNAAGSTASNNCTLTVNPVPPSGASTTTVVK